MKVVEESGMKFVFEDDTCFHLEEEVEQIRSCSSHVKVVECVTVPKHGARKGVVMFIEAKTSAPNHANCVVGNVKHNGKPLEPNWKLQTPLDCYCQDVAQKFIDSFSLWQACHLGRHEDKNGNEYKMPPFTKLIAKDDIPLFVLIISKFKVEWLQPVKDALNEELRHFMNAWNIKPTALRVLTPDLAKDLLDIDVSLQIK